MEEVYFIKHEPTGFFLSDFNRDAWTLSSFGRSWWFTRTDAEIGREKLAALHPEVEGYAEQLVVVPGQRPQPAR